MKLEFSGELFFWRGPAPHFFVRVPEAQSQAIADVAKLVSYGWGAIPVEVEVGKSTWETSLFPKDGRYLVPIRLNVRKAEKLEEGDTVKIRMTVATRSA